MSDETVSERDFGRVLEALQQGKEERADLRRTMADTIRMIAEVRETLVEFRSELKTVQESDKTVVELSKRLDTIETRVGDLANRVQVQESFINVTKTWSLRAVIAVLLGLAMGATALSKFIDLILRFAGK